MKKSLIAAIAVVLVLALAAPAFAQMTHSANYEMDGVIDLQKQAGHWCNTGAEVKQTIKGSGVLDKQQDIHMIPGRISMQDVNDGVAGETALTITTVWELCAPPKYTYDAGLEVAYVPSALELYEGARGDGVLTPWGLGNVYGTPYDLAEAYNMTALTNQIWAVQVQADPGFSINLHQDGEAAHGPYSEFVGSGYNAWLKDTGWDGAGVGKDSDTWKYFSGSGAKVGPDYVGSYFTMDQMARTSQGTLKRYIDISSPFNHGYLMEDMSVTGKSKIEETFAMYNLPKGADILKDWWDLF